MEWDDIAQRIKAGEDGRQKTYDTFGFILTEEQVIPSARMEDKEMREFNGTEPEIVQDVGGKFVQVTFRKGVGM